MHKDGDTPTSLPLPKKTPIKYCILLRAKIKLVMRNIFFSLFTLLLFIYTSCSTSNTTDIMEDEKTDSTSSFTVPYEKFTLDNGLEVILHEDHSDPIVAVATVMHVGSNREKPGKTGFAHFFEHMSFNDSENTPVGANRKLINEWGGDRNGGTWSDGTIYYEVVPKDAFEKILWIDSDRFGYMINTVTQAALEREKQVVKNEKRERVDNAPYGYTGEIIRKNLYPKDHPYHWTVIGSLPDLQSATLDDVKEFYEQYYGAANGSLVIAGDIDVPKTKKLVQQWFGEIRRGPDVQPLQPRPVTLDGTKNVYFEDNFAKLPELRMVFPTVEQYTKDENALRILAQLLSGNKKSPLYQNIVEKSKLAPRVSAYQDSNELAGEFAIVVRANANTDLDTVKEAIEVSFKQFEENGFSEQDLKAVKARLETEFYQDMSSVLDKAFTLVQYNEFQGDPGYASTVYEQLISISKEDILTVYNKYIKNRPYVLSSVIPMGQKELAVTNSKEAKVWIEEVKKDVAEEEVAQGEEAVYEKTASIHDRSEPDFGELPLFSTPEIWTSPAANGITLYGIENNELPLVTFDLTIKGGQLLDTLKTLGTSNLMAGLLKEGTLQKTPAELEKAIQLLGASISIRCYREEIRITANCLSKNFKETFELVREILLQPRWDTDEFKRLKRATLTQLRGQKANAQRIGRNNFDRLVYGDSTILGSPITGTLESVERITLEDVKAQYQKLAAQNTSFHIVGDVSQEVVKKVVIPFANEWKTEPTPIVIKNIPRKDPSDILYFIDVPGAKQSVIYLGNQALPATHKDYARLTHANEVLGGGSSGQLFQTLRIQKGYTYGAYSGLIPMLHTGNFIARTNVRANATLASLQIIKELIEKYGREFDNATTELTKNKVIKTNTLAFESIDDKIDILRTISKYGRPHTFIEDEQKELLQMTAEDFRRLINQYFVEKDMFYIVVGDKATQWEEVQKFGRKVIELDIQGKPKELIE